MSQPVDLVAEAALLRRRLDRERRARLTAESVGEAATARLYETVRQLQEAEAELRRHAEEQELLNDLLRDVRRDLDPEGILRRTVTAVGAAADVDRCLVRMADGDNIGPVVEQWTRPGVAPVEPTTALPTALEHLCLQAADRHQCLRIDDVLDDARLPDTDAAAVRDALGITAYLGAPMWTGDHLVGWLVMHATTPSTPWTPRQLTIMSGVARDLGAALLQAAAYQQKEAAVLQLERADRVKNELVSTVSHELRTPLSSIVGYIELLREGEVGELTAQQLHVLAVLSRNSMRLQLLIEDLLSLARVDAGVSLPPCRPVDVGKLLEDVRRAVLPMARTRDIDLGVTNADAVPPVPARGVTDLERALFNLVTNAIKFTPAGGSVLMGATSADDVVTIRVSDTGHGIDARDIPHVAERFYRSADATDRAIQGTGLGLAVVKAITDQHGGRLEIESEVGRGTQVSIHLPADEQASDQPFGKRVAPSAHPSGDR
ncbi:GAF domain-containing protein [Nocardioides sp. HDW12B]|uniref:GAF domain-containing sensor histidine kinase n=1 Tax=Nocardioides sp. HDW12B TaxID=2714939 RepID=UPI001408CFD2|nr:ATP-binding protein [Nocardioides sp. HDW12B]QIK64931.1 GAF domain-containing protein [Nocardioides sp. HDW12B]